jgi:hypothetical protein
VLVLSCHVIVVNVEHRLPFSSQSAGICVAVSQFCSQLHTNCHGAEWYLA